MSAALSEHVSYNAKSSSVIPKPGFKHLRLYYEMRATAKQNEQTTNKWLQQNMSLLQQVMW